MTLRFVWVALAGADGFRLGARLADLIEQSCTFLCRIHGPPCDLTEVTEPTVRYHDSHQSSSFIRPFAVSLRMIFLCRFFLVGLLALFAMNGASACTSMQRDADASRVPHVAHQVFAAGDRCGVMERAGSASSHGHCAGGASGCAAGCCVHCGAPPVQTRISAGAPGRSPRFALASALRAGITHAPALPPPIV
ncbi:hypothetical protein [Paraburkholderia sp. J63]|uniref:hypothetical protein n=1 Tax=Paraburkholderia sp. J63 TaxID=2805434 RepID=UPI002ABE40A9|nr:hypothetical protein [Paraburkholderia sp. J63]